MQSVKFLSTAQRNPPNILNRLQMKYHEILIVLEIRSLIKSLISLEGRYYNGGLDSSRANFTIYLLRRVKVRVSSKFYFPKSSNLHVVVPRIGVDSESTFCGSQGREVFQTLYSRCRCPIRFLFWTLPVDTFLLVRVQKESLSDCK